VCELVAKKHYRTLRRVPSQAKAYILKSIKSMKNIKNGLFKGEGFAARS